MIKYVFLYICAKLNLMANKKSVEPSSDKSLLLKAIGEKVRMLRKSHSEYINYEVFAFKNDINKVTLSKIENGENHNIASLIKVLNALNVSLEEFFTGIK